MVGTACPGVFYIIQMFVFGRFPGTTAADISLITFYRLHLVSFVFLTTK